MRTALQTISGRVAAARKLGRGRISAGACASVGVDVSGDGFSLIALPSACD